MILQIGVRWKEKVGLASVHVISGNKQVNKQIVSVKHIVRSDKWQSAYLLC